ncbi:MAG: DNA repair protein RecO [Anaerovoracaceae bacterium]|jgi:DNA repair protein RecO (recombination protein O)
MSGITEGIVLRQVKILGGRKMLTVFTRDFGKISAGTYIGESGKSRSALAVRPFVLGRYDVRDRNGSMSIRSAEVIKSHYGIGQDIDKFADCSYALEFLSKLLQEDYPMPELFSITADFLDVMEERRGETGTLLLAYIVKALAEAGYTPQTEECASCGRKRKAAAFSVRDGGVICADCAKEKNGPGSLIYEVDFGIVDILKYFLETPMQDFRKLSLGSHELTELGRIMKEYSAYYLDIGKLRSESFFGDI